MLWVNNMGTLGDYLLKEINRDICQIRTERLTEAVRILRAKNTAPKNKKGIDVPDFSNTEEKIIQGTVREILNRTKYRCNDYWIMQDNAIKVIFGIPLT